MARDASLTFGGGTATTEVLRRSLVRRGWIANETHALVYGVSRLTPGTNLLAYCTTMGWLTRKGPGAVVSLVGASVPPAILSIAVTTMYERIGATPLLSPILTFAMTVALFFVFASAWQLSRPYLTRRAAARTAAIAAVVLSLTALGVTPVQILLVAAVAGALMASPS